MTTKHHQERRLQPARKGDFSRPQGQCAAQRRTEVHRPCRLKPALRHLVELGSDGSLWLAGDDGPVAARVLASVSLADLRRASAAGLPLLVAGDERQPVVLGVVLGRAEEGPALTDADGRTVLTAARQLVLRCGAAAISLGGDGQVAISGTDVRSRARRLQRITGAQVKIN